MGYGSTTREADMLTALQSMDADTAILAGAISGGQVQVDIAGLSLSSDGVFYGSSSGYGIADSLYNSSFGGTVADMLYSSSASKSVADMLYNSSASESVADMLYYSGYSLAYMMYELYMCISGGRLLTSPDNY